MTLGAIQDDSLIYEMTSKIAEDCKRMGIYWDFAPVVDVNTCLLYTSDAADERSSVDLGGRRIIKKKTIDNTEKSASVQNIKIKNQYKSKR